jgi:CubicO group peptidase (beta-lactamase class C family)
MVTNAALRIATVFSLRRIWQFQNGEMLRLALSTFISLVLPSTWLIAAEGAGGPDGHTTPSARTAPVRGDDGWETASPVEAGVDPELIDQMVARIADGTYKNIHSVVLVKDGRLVVDEYFAGRDGEGKDHSYDRETLHSLQSVTKSVNSILVGIALDQHLLQGEDQKISPLFPEYAGIFAEAAKDGLRLKHFLSMTGGFAWTESGVPYTDPRNDAYVMNRNADPFRYVLEKPLTESPGRKFLYHTGLSVLLGEIVRRASGQEVDVFAEKNLFEPLGITDWYWARLRSGAVHTGGGLWLQPRDMAKIGALYLNGGRWNGKQIVSEGWVRKSTTQQAPFRGYGYQWWLHTFRGRDRAIDAFAAQGLGGQFIFVFPDRRLVAVFTGWNMGSLTEQPFEMLQRYVVPATEAQ